MKNTFGQSVYVTLFGESHGEYIGAVIDGIAPGVTLDYDFIKGRLEKRRPSGDYSTKRTEEDDFKIVSGVFEGKTTGAPLTLLIPNSDIKSGDYRRGDFRPGHADYTADVKYHGFEDYRGGGHFSGRVTAALTAAGAICELILAKKNIFIGTHILSCAKVSDRAFCDINSDIKILNNASFPVLSAEAGEQMKEKIKEAAKELDSVGGVSETAVIGLPAGIGEPWFDTVEGVLSHALYSVPGVKGVEFGAGFSLAEMNGSRANDAYYLDNGSVYTKTNNCGGVCGGITNGMPVLFRCAVKPTPTVAHEQDTVGGQPLVEKRVSFGGRHDPAIIHRACPVISAITAITVCDLLAQRYGTDFITTEKF